MHVACLVQLGHGRIHQWVAGAAFAPRRKQCIGMFAVVPFDGVVGGLERAGHHVRVVGHDLVVKIPPDQFAQPHTGTVVALGMQCIGCARQQANRHSAKPKVHPQVAGSLDGREVARGAVVVYAL